MSNERQAGDDAPDKPRRVVTAASSNDAFDAGLLAELRQQVANGDMTEAEAAAQARRCCLPW